MRKRKNYEEHEDLKLFEIEYKSKIDKFLSTEQDSKVVFLNADYGYGKTTFIQNNLRIEDNSIYSPWLHKSDNYIEDIYFHVNKKSKSKASSIALIITIIVTSLATILGIVTPILIELLKANHNSLKLLLLCITVPAAVILTITCLLIYFNPVPLINFYKKGNSKNYEKKLIKKILKKVKTAFVIEDIDRIDDIEEVLIVANKISEYIKEENIKTSKYILITGDYNRTISRLNNPASYDSYGGDLQSEKNKGAFLMEKIVSLRIDFPSIEKRISTVLKEYNLTQEMTKIEYDEIINFIRVKSIGIRLFTRFLELNKDKINEGYSIYHLLLEYYHEEKNYISDERIIANTLYNTIKFPVCMNDIEMFLEKKKIKLPNMEYKKLEKVKNPKLANEKITNIFIDIINKDKETIKVFKEFYNGIYYPVTGSDKLEADERKTIGSGITIKEQLDEYLIGCRKDELGTLEKRCYFKPINKSRDYDAYKIDKIWQALTAEVNPVYFIAAYIACFLRDNKEEIEKNYKNIYKIVEEISAGR